MEHVFWVYPNEVAGRPGPGVAPWDLEQLKVGGVDLVVSLATDLFPHSDAVRAGMPTCIRLRCSRRHGATRTHESASGSWPVSRRQSSRTLRPPHTP